LFGHDGRASFDQYYGVVDDDYEKK
jgi:hypothetical protein